RRRTARERKNRLEVVVGEPELQADEVVAAIRVEDLVDTAEQPELADELVRERDAPARSQRFAEAEEVLLQLEAIVEQVQVQADAAGRLQDAEAAGKWTHSLGKLEREAKGALGRRSDLAIVRRIVRVRRVDVDLLEARLASRIIDELDQ